MKIVVIGGTGLIGTKVVNELRGKGHQVVAGSPSTGINTLTGEGVAEALQGADVVMDLANFPSFEDKVVMDFFQTSGKNLLAAEKEAGVKHHLILSIVGTDVMTGSGYMRAKVAQEELAKQSRIPYTIQRFRFIEPSFNQILTSKILITKSYTDPYLAERVINDRKIIQR